MKQQAFQPGEIRDENDRIIRSGAYGKNTPLVTADNRGILDYIMNNFDVLAALVAGSIVYCDSRDALPGKGQDGKIYIARDSGKTYRWDGTKYVECTIAAAGGGAEGPQGPKGDTGASAYDIWKAHGHSGSEEDFLSSLKGEKGDRGEPGSGIAGEEATYNEISTAVTQALNE